MLVSINWIRDYVDLDGCDIKELINKFTLATAESRTYIIWAATCRRSLSAR